jgi:hypothetical protein
MPMIADEFVGSGVAYITSLLIVMIVEVWKGPKVSIKDVDVYRGNSILHLGEEVQCESLDEVTIGPIGFEARVP